MDKITNENTLIGKHNLETIEDVLAFKLDLNNQIENWMNQRRSIYNKIKRTRDPELKQQLEQDKNAERVVFEWQEGGHFGNVQERIALGIRWILT